MAKPKASYRAQKKNRQGPSPLLWGGLAVGLVIVVAVIITQLGSPQAASTLPAEISVAQAHEKYEKDSFFLDVRTQEEWNDYHIPETTLIPLDQLSSRVNELPKDREIVIVCRSGNRSAQARDFLREAGFDQTTSMAGGVSQWQSSGYPTVSGP